MDPAAALALPCDGRPPKRARRGPCFLALLPDDVLDALIDRCCDNDLWSLISTCKQLREAVRRHVARLCPRFNDLEASQSTWVASSRTYAAALGERVQVLLRGCFVDVQPATTDVWRALGDFLRKQAAGIDDDVDRRLVLKNIDCTLRPQFGDVLFSPDGNLAWLAPRPALCTNCPSCDNFEFFDLRGLWLHRLLVDTRDGSVRAVPPLLNGSRAPLRRKRLLPPSFSPDGNLLALHESSPSDLFPGQNYFVTTIWDTRTLLSGTATEQAGDSALQAELYLGRGETPRPVVFSPDGRWAALSTYEDWTVQLADLRAQASHALRAVDPPVPWPPGRHGVDALAFAPDSSKLATAARNRLKLWDLSSPQAIQDGPVNEMLLGGPRDPERTKLLSFARWRDAHGNEHDFLVGFFYFGGPAAPKQLVLRARSLDTWLPVRLLRNTVPCAFRIQSDDDMDCQICTADGFVVDAPDRRCQAAFQSYGALLTTFEDSRGSFNNSAYTLQRYYSFPGSPRQRLLRGAQWRPFPRNAPAQAGAQLADNQGRLLRQLPYVVV